MLREKEEDLKRLREQGGVPFNAPFDTAHSLPVIRVRDTQMRTPKSKNIKRAQWAVVVSKQQQQQTSKHLYLACL